MELYTLILLIVLGLITILLIFIISVVFGSNEKTFPSLDENCDKFNNIEQK